MGSLPPPPTPILAPDFESRAAVEAADIDTEITFVRTAGYTTPGDGGGALYARVASEPAHNLKIQSNDGAFWELVAENGVVTEKQAGGIGDGVADDTAAIQSAIDFCIYSDGAGNDGLPVAVRLMGPLLRTTDTIHLGYGEDFHGVTVRGVGIKRRAEAKNTGTAIQADFNDRPIFNIQGARRTILSDLWIEGTFMPTSMDFFSIEPTIEANWDALGGNGRYNPYAAITIDAYSGTRPAESYPDVSYPAFLQPVAQYDKFFSSDVIIERIGVRRVNTALAIQPCDADGNGDFVKVRDCSFNCCKYAVSVGNAQARNLELRNINGSEMFVFATNDAHGRQVGFLGGPIDNCSFFGFVGSLFRFNKSRSVGTPLFSNLYAENLHRIGDFTANSNEEIMLTFQSCQFEFRHSDTAGVPANILAGINETEVVFRGCLFVRAPSVYSFSIPNVQMHECRSVVTDRSSGTIPRYEAFAHNATSGGVVIDPLRLRPQGIGFTRFNLDTGAVIGGVLPRETGPADGARSIGLPQAVWEFRHGSDFLGETFRKRIAFFSVPKSSGFSSVSLSNRTLTLQFTSLAEDRAMRLGVEPGDVIRDGNTGMIFFIRARTGTTVTAEAQNNYISNGGGGFDTMTAFSATSGSLQFMNSRLYVPNFVTLADFSDGSNTATAIGRFDGFATYLDADVEVGDYIYTDLDRDALFINGEGELTAIDTSARTFTFAGNARNTVDRKVLPVWIRTPPPNA